MFSRWLLGTALALPVALVAGVLVAAAVVRGQRPGPLRLGEVPAPAAGSAGCVRLLAALPDELSGPDGLDRTAQGHLQRRQLAGPGLDAGVAAWGEPPVVLRCGLNRPAELTASARLLDVSGVQFLQLAAPEPGSPGGSSWVAVDRAEYVMVTLPAGSGSGPLQQLAEEITGTMAPQDVELPP